MMAATEFDTPGILPRLIERAAEAYGVRPIEVRSQRRSTPFVRARWAVMWAAYQGTEYSYPRIGRSLGARDHTTVIHRVREAFKLRETDPVFHALTEDLLSSLEGGSENPPSVPSAFATSAAYPPIQNEGEA